jgi:hypothetical protein
MRPKRALRHGQTMSVAEAESVGERDDVLDADPLGFAVAAFGDDLDYAARRLALTQIALRRKASALFAGPELPGTKVASPRFFLEMRARPTSFGL